MSQLFKHGAIALALSQLFPVSAHAADAQMAPVIVTASRFSETDSAVPANVTVITREDIRNNPALTLPDLLNSRAGVTVRGYGGALASSTVVDLRGFGDTAGSNTLILLDGVRLNSIDSAGVNWALIPPQSVERIEILRGSGAVLFGDRASGGVVNIITQRQPVASTVATVTAGSYGYKGVDAQTSGSFGEHYTQLIAHAASSDGWRSNSQADELSFFGRVGHKLSGGNVYLDLLGNRDSAGLSGALFSNQFQTQPTQTRHPLDSQSRASYQVRPGVVLALNPKLALEGELSFLHSHNRSSTGGLSAISYVEDRIGETWAITPRLRWQHGLGSLSSETVAGLDYYAGRLTADSVSASSGANTQRASQKSQAVYVQNVTHLSNTFDLSAGARSQTVSQAAQDVANGIDSGARRERAAWEIGLTAHPGENSKVYGKLGRTFRFANTDELFGYDPLTFAPLFRGDLRPQQGSLREVGAAWRGAELSLRGALHQLNLTDEIAYDGAQFINTNLPETRHQGLELEAQWRLASVWHVRLAYTYDQATFRAGSNAGKDIPTIPKDKIGFELGWQGGQWGNWTAVTNYTGRQRYSGDEANTLNVRNGYSTVDIKASWDIKPFSLALKVANLTDKRYAASAGYSSFSSDYFYYPGDPRSIFLSLGYQYK